MGALDAAAGRWPALLMELGGLSAEQWAPIPGFDGFYEVSTQGRVKSLERTVFRSDGQCMTVKQCIIKPHRRKSGYVHVVLRKDNTAYTRTVHRLVLEAFVGLRPHGMECCHCNGIPDDNRLANLRWDTPLGNGFDRKAHGTANQGFSNPRARLTPAEIVAIRRAEGSNSKVAAAFGVSAETVRRIRKGIRWSFVEAA
jgi:hypothetical protein